LKEWKIKWNSNLHLVWNNKAFVLPPPSTLSLGMEEFFILPFQSPLSFNEIDKQINFRSLAIHKTC
jgi:hypothetical protein